MLYGIGVADKDELLKQAMAALPDCFSQELSNCLDHKNVDGLPAAQCKALVDAFASDATYDRINDATNNLPICTGPSMVPFVGGAFAVGVLLTVMLVKR